MPLPTVTIKLVQADENPGDGWLIGQIWDNTQNEWIDSDCYYYQFGGGNGPNSNGDVYYAGNLKQNFQIELINAGDGWKIIEVTVAPALAKF